MSAAVGAAAPLNELRIRQMLGVFERWLRAGPEKSSVTFNRHNGSVWCKGQVFHGTPEEVLAELCEPGFDLEAPGA